MNQRYIFFSLILLFSVAIISYRVTYALFSSSASNNGNVFSASTAFPTSTPTPTTPITPTPTPQAGEVIINEINWGGNNHHDEDEWIELRNTTTHAIDLNGCIIENLGTGDVTIPSGKTISANGYFLISFYTKDNVNSRLNVDPDMTAILDLDDKGEQLKLKTSTAVLIDTANQTDDHGKWCAGEKPDKKKDKPAKSMERKSPPNDGADCSNWQTATTHTGLDNSGTTDEFGTPKNLNP